MGKYTSSISSLVNTNASMHQKTKCKRTEISSICCYLIRGMKKQKKLKGVNLCGYGLAKRFKISGG